MHQAKCPICKKAFEFASIRECKTYPFCSEPCRLLDLGSWMRGDYQVSRDAEPEEMLDGSLADPSDYDPSLATQTDDDSLTDTDDPDFDADADADADDADGDDDAGGGR